MGFFATPRPRSLAELATAGEAALARGAPDMSVDAIGPIENCTPGALGFVTGGAYLQALPTTKAGAVVVAEKHLDRVPDGVAALVASDPYRAFAKMAALLYPAASTPLSVTGETGISPKAFIGEKVTLGENVTIEAGAVIGRGARLADGVRVLANAVVGADVTIGEGTVLGVGSSALHARIGARCVLHPGARIGQDGFGYAMGPQGHIRVPQVGAVEIGDDVDIGAGTTIDRGANRDTVIGSGTKIDNLVQIGHNCVLGRHCVLAGGVMMAGSCELGDFVVMGGATAVTGHVKLGTGAQVSGMSAVSEDVEPGKQVGGIPARAIRQYIKEVAAIRRAARKEER